MTAALEPLRVETVPFAHADAQRLVEEVQQEYVERYGGRDNTPLDLDEFEPGRGLFLVGYLGAVPVASAAWRWHPPVDGVPEAPLTEIKRMYVARAHRRQGHAARLLDALEASAAAAGSAVMILETGTGQPEAIALYERSGYLPIPGFGHYRSSPLSRCFAKPLPQPVGPLTPRPGA